MTAQEEIRKVIKVGFEEIQTRNSAFVKRDNRNINTIT